MNIPIILPAQSEGAELPQWVGNGFKIGDEFTKVLQYSSNALGWTDDLTSFHEDNAGEHHFIDKASRNHALSQLKNIASKESSIILEIGCSSGYMLKQIKETYPKATVIGADVVYEPLVTLANNMPDVPLLRFDLTKCPLPDNCVDAIVMLNVLEHIEDHATAIQQAFRILKPNGILIIEVPAGPQLYDCYDKLLCHFRRYKLADLSELATKNGFKILKKSHLGFFLYPAFAHVKYRNKKKYGLNVENAAEVVKKNISQAANNPLLNMLMKLELAVGNLISYPIGIRCLLTCRKP